MFGIIFYLTLSKLLYLGLWKTREGAPSAPFLKEMVRVLQLFRLGFTFINVEYFAYYRKFNGRRKPEIFYQMYRIPEKNALMGVLQWSWRQLSGNSLSVEHSWYPIIARLIHLSNVDFSLKVT